MTEKKYFDIIVIGSGLAGLSACDNLCNNCNRKIEILLIEGRDRVGGRTETINFDFGNVDVGGQWIGPQHSFMLNLISRFNLSLKEQVYSLSDSSRLVEFYKINLKTLEQNEYNEISKFMEYVDELCNIIDINNPWSLPNAEFLDSLLVYDYINDNIKSVNAKIEITLCIQTILASSTKNCSLLCFIYYIASGGGLIALGDGEQGAQKWTINGGSQQISQLLYNNIKDKNISSCFNAVVTEINENIDEDYKLSVVFNNNNSTYTVFTKHIIVALSPSLAISKIKFQRNILSDEKIILYQNMTNGKCVKLILIYEQEFWNNSNNQEISLSDVNDFIIHNIFYSKVSSKSALVCLITGDSVDKYLQNNYEDRQNLVFNQLKFMYSCENDIYKYPIQYIEKDWCNEELSGGCYASIIKPNYLYKYGKYLRSNSNNIYWASCEVVSEYYGYMEGAVRSGYNAANEILEKLN